MENIQEETDPAIIQMYVAQKQQFLRGGGRALKLALDRMSPSYNVRASVGFVREYKLNKEQQKKLEAVYKWKSLEQDKLIKRMGKRDLINTDGSISDVHVVRSVDPSLDAESVRVMRRLPSFAPLICPIHKRKVAVYYTAPINFQLQ